jgi:hypothetical protein
MPGDTVICLGAVTAAGGRRPPPGFPLRVGVAELHAQYEWLCRRHDDGPEVEGLLSLLSAVMSEVGDDWLPPEETVAVPVAAARCIDL